MSDAPSAGRVEVVICGPGHHDRAERARPVVAAIAAIGIEVAVQTDLRPRLADDIRSLLDAGASFVRLEAEGMVGDLVSAAQQISPGVVVVVLRPGPLVEPEVRGDGALAGSVREAIAALTAAHGERR
jgi:hypothetical protein